MIIEIPKVKELDAQSSASAVNEASRDVPEEAPPGYTQCSTSQADPYELPNIPPSNFLSLQRNHASIDGTWVIDPGLSIPEFLLPSIKPGETRKNLILESGTASVNAEVWLVPQTTTSITGPSARVSMEFISRCDYIRVKLHRNDEHPMHVACYSNGNITVLLPRNFRGLVSSRSFDGQSHCSNDMFARTTVISEVNGERRAFVGNLPTAHEGDEWKGDELVLHAHMGGIKISYEDEKRPRFARSRPSSMLVSPVEQQNDPEPNAPPSPPESPGPHHTRHSNVLRGTRRSSTSLAHQPPQPPRPPNPPIPSTEPFNPRARFSHHLPGYPGFPQMSPPFMPAMPHFPLSPMHFTRPPFWPQPPGPHSEPELGHGPRHN